MARVAVIHWKPEEAAPMVAALTGAGFEAAAVAPAGGAGLAQLMEPAPSALVIDLTRLPSQGKAVAEHWRLSRKTRNIPIVFAGGVPDKVAGVKERFPDAAYSDPAAIVEAVRRAIRLAPDEPVVHRSMSEYTGTPLAKKLGIKAGSGLTMLGAPQGFERTLQPLPDGVEIHRRATPAVRVLLFVDSAAGLRRRFRGASDCVVDGGGLWIIYPKQASGVGTDLTQASVRAFALAAGWVDYKICAVDETWTGLLFARRGSR